MAIGTKAFDFRSKALVEDQCDACDTMRTPGLAGQIEDVRWRSNATDLVVVARRRAFLVLSQAWSPGWSAFVDGHAVTVLRANALVVGVPVPHGRHRVRLTYRPPGLTAGLVLSGGSLAGLVLASAFLVATRRRRQVKTATSRRQRRA
jgi:uncharacterized membrane protein YfhO